MLASYRDIGVVKALGFSPGLVVLSFVGQMLTLALVGCAAGATLGVVGSGSIFRSSAAGLGVPALNLVTDVEVLQAG